MEATDNNTHDLSGLADMLGFVHVDFPVCEYAITRTNFDAAGRMMLYSACKFNGLLCEYVQELLKCPSYKAQPAVLITSFTVHSK